MTTLPQRLFAVLLLLSSSAVAQDEPTWELLSPSNPQPFRVYPLADESAYFTVEVPPDACTMRVWTEGATDDVMLEIYSDDDEFGMTYIAGYDIWLNEEVMITLADMQPLYPGSWTIEILPGASTIHENFPNLVFGTVHVEFPEPKRATLVPDAILELDLLPSEGLRAILELPADFEPGRRTRWRVEAYSPTADIDLIVGPAELPGTVDYPYDSGLRVLNYESCEFQGRQVKNLAIHVFGIHGGVLDPSIPVRVRLTEIREAELPSSLVPMVELPRPLPAEASNRDRALAATVALFGPQGGGSGTLFSSNGLILTNAHVATVRPGDQTPAARRKARKDGFEPKFFAGFQRDVRQPTVPECGLELLASREDLDLALLCVATTLDGRPLESAPLPAMPRGDSTQLALGDELFVLGFPMTGGGASLVSITLTRGICSGFSLEEEGPAIKTDAAVHAGVSGGALLDASWKLIGIPSSSITDENYSGGLGFSIPVESIPASWLELAQRGDLTRVMAALNGELPTGLQPFPGTDPVEWALACADVVQLSDPSLTADALQQVDALLELRGVNAFPALLGGLSNLDLESPKGRTVAPRLQAALDRLLQGVAPTWSTSTGSDSEPVENEEAVARLTEEWQHVLEHPHYWVELAGLGRAGNESARHSFEKRVLAAGLTLGPKPHEHAPGVR